MISVQNTLDALKETRCCSIIQMLTEESDLLLWKNQKQCGKKMFPRQNATRVLKLLEKWMEAPSCQEKWMKTPDCYIQKLDRSSWLLRSCQKTGLKLRPIQAAGITGKCGTSEKKGHFRTSTSQRLKQYQQHREINIQCQKECPL